MSARVRRIRPDEALRFRALRLGALADSPLAFGSTLAREEAFSEEVWTERATKGAAGEDQVTFVAEDGDRWIGTATGLVESPNEPKVTLVGMFVEPGARGRGIGRALVEAVVAWAEGRRARRLTLWVTSTNHPAMTLYRRCGFEPTGKSQPLDHALALTEVQMAREVP